MSLEHFIRLADSIVEFESDLNENCFPINSIAALEVHKNELNTSWSTVKAAYENIIYDQEKDTKKSKDHKENLALIKSKYKRTYSAYCKGISALADIEEKIHKESKQHSSSGPMGSDSDQSIPGKPTPASDSHSFHLPPCDIGIFSGDYQSWPTFRDMFAAVYINNVRLSPVERLFHLTQKTAGEAREIVKKSPLTNQGFDLAWTNLCSRYENRRILINGQLKILFNLQSIKTESGTSMRKLQRDINACISILQLYEIDVKSWDPLFVFLCSNRLPDVTLSLWEQGLVEKTNIPKWSELDTFLTNRFQTLESVAEIRNNNTGKSSDNVSKSFNKIQNTKRVHAFQNNVAIPKCPLCSNETHIIRKCPKFIRMNYEQRFSEIKKQGLCINCFSKSHSVKNCTSKHGCYICKKRHNTLLHREIRKENSVLTTLKPESSSSICLNPNSPPFNNSISSCIQSTENIGGGLIQSCFASNSKGVLLGTAMISIFHLNSNFTVRALIDTGSEGTFVSERLFNLLKLPNKKTKCQISGLNHSISANVQRECYFSVGSLTNNSIKIPVSALVVPHLACNIPSRTVDSFPITELPNIPLADPKFFESSKIDILLGGDIIPSIMLHGIMHKVCGSLIAQETIFGWILTGPISIDTPKKPSNILSYFCEITLDKEISRFWEVEDLPRKNIMSSNDKFCEDLYVRTTKRNKEGRYIVQLPFKEGFPNDITIGHSRANAMAQLFRNEARLLKNPQFKKEYDSVLQEYIQLNHMSEVNPSNNGFNYYLPHHAVVKPDSTTTRVRVVFNASSPTSNGLSLNDILYPGPTLQSDLTILILKWRFFRYVFNADIQKMYRQILVDPKHSPFQRILFRSDLNEKIRDYELKTVSFGVNCAPYLALRTIQHLSDEVKSTFPIASEILRNNMYVDDVLAGAHLISEAKAAKNELIQALQTAGFSLRKWTANSKYIIDDIPINHWLNEDFLDFDNSSMAKTLGICWNARTDKFYFNAKPYSIVDSYTKREVLSQIAKLFDPAGWLSPCVILAKVLMQKIWLQGCGWDENLPTALCLEWITFQKSYSAINDIQIPRWIDYCPSAVIEFHGFCDASEKAYAAALYVRIIKGDSISTHLLTSKTRVAPVKTISIPRLELCGAVLLAEIIDSLIFRINLCKYSVHCWTDSTIVLSWLAKSPCSWLTFVANRTSRIIQVVSPSQWHHVRSEHNPADLASRGVFPQDLIGNDLWWHGPTWLKSSLETILDNNYQNQIHETGLERKTIKAYFTYFQNYEDLLERFSSYSRAIRVVAYIFRFFHRTHPKYRNTFNKSDIALSNSEIKLVQDALISVCQKFAYPNEFKALLSKQLIASSSTILSLNPFIDQNGLIRCNGRLASSAVLAFDEKHPIIIPYSCQFSRLLVKFIHETSLHGGNQLVLRLLRIRYWIPKVKNLIKTIVNKCKPCILYRKRCQKQIMSALPKNRVEFSRPFTHTGLDFAGPFDIKTFKGRGCCLTKGYVCLFVCFTTKAIHLELTSDLSTPAFLAAFHRFVSRRGCPLHLHSDNGTTFVGASKVLAREFLQTSQLALMANYLFHNITWHFIPPGAPHMGGLWEAGVKSFKIHFRKTAGNYKYTFEEFTTLLSRIEACLNSRPLTPMSQDPSDLSALTPGHFLIGCPIMTPLDPEISETSISLINRWQRLKLVFQNFSHRWKSEYLKELQRRTKWKTPQQDLKENSLVVIKEENLPPNSWRLGRIVKVYLGNDKRVRVAEIKTQRGIITRPITKIILLPSE